jgi:hypothetical protein
MERAGVKSYIEATRVGLNQVEKVEMDDEDEPDRFAGEVSADDI